MWLRVAYFWFEFTPKNNKWTLKQPRRQQHGCWTTTIKSTLQTLANPENKAPVAGRKQTRLFLGHHPGGRGQAHRLHDLLAANQFTQQQEFSTTFLLADPKHPGTFMDDLFAYYILPFHKDYSDSSTCHTPLSSNPASISNSVENLDYLPEERELTHKDLKKAVE